jgi:hypothetical protein
MAISNYGDGGTGIFNYSSSGGGGSGSSPQYPKVKIEPISNTSLFEYTLPVIEYSSDYVKLIIKLAKVTPNSFVVTVKSGNGQTFLNRTGADSTAFTIDQQNKWFEFIPVSNNQWSIIG